MILTPLGDAPETIQLYVRLRPVLIVSFRTGRQIDRAAFRGVWVEKMRGGRTNSAPYSRPLRLEGEPQERAAARGAFEQPFRQVGSALA
jgi:hypothetical protein